MTQRFWKWPKYLVNGLDTWGTTFFYLTNGFTMLEMAYEFDTRLKYVGNYVYMWEMA